MGMQASAALLLKALTDKEDKWLEKDAIKLVEKFSLFAIILADPVKDPGFYKFAQKNFPFFDRLTGENFLFFSIIKDAQYPQENEQRSFRQFYDLQAYKHNNAAEMVIYSELAIHAICTIMGIDYDESPCMVVSNDLRFGQFCKLETNTKILEKQLKELSSLADYLKQAPLERSLKEMLIKFNETRHAFNNVETLEIDSNIIGIVSEVLQSVSSDPFFRSKRFNLKTRINEKYSVGNKILKPEKLDDAISLLNVYERQEGGKLYEPHYAEVSGEPIHGIGREKGSIKMQIQNNEAEPGYLKDAWDNIQSETRNYLKAALVIRKYNYRLFKIYDDYSIYTFPICKAFEKEINLSVVQFLRKVKGVPMPDFYAKHYPQSDDIPVKPSPELIPNPREIYLNKLSAGKWIPPGLGESRIVFASLRLENPALATDWQTKEKLDLLNKNWSVIYKIRNLTTHSDPVPGTQMGLLENSMRELYENGLLNSLTSLKIQLRQ